MYRLVLVLRYGVVLGISGDLRTVLSQGRLSGVPCYVVRS
jgi:hypothetical protein